MELYKWQELQTLNFLIELPSEFVGVGITFALPQYN